MNPEETYERLLKAAAHERTKRNLTILRDALLKMRDDGVSDYSIAKVGAYSKTLGGPQAQSIRNKNGAHFQSLIKAFAASEGKPQKKLPARPESNVDAAIRAIADQGVRLALEMRLAQARRDRSELDMLRSAFKNLSVSISSGSHPSAAAGTALVGKGGGETHRDLTSPLAAAIEKFLSSDWLDERFWKVDADGSIVDESIGGALIAPPGFVDALREILRPEEA